MGGFTNLPAIFDERLDGNLTIVPVNNNPIVMVLGTASQGDSETIHRVDRVSDSARVFGKSTGTLSRGLYEVSTAGALNIRLFRIGATSAVLSGIGVVTGGSPLAGFTLETVSKDDSAGTDYKLTYDASAARVIVWRVSDDEIVFDNNPAYPLNAVDLGEVVLSGSGGDDALYGDLGVVASGVNGAVTLAAAEDDYVTGGGVGPVFTAGTDGINLSRMEMYEALHNAYELLGDQELDVLIPMNVYLDDLNIVDIGQAEATSRGLAAIGGAGGKTYPTASSSTDVLGKLYHEEVDGVNYFWWWFPSDTDTGDPDSLFVTDAGANIWPSVNSASATLKSDGTALLGSDFHEVNFGYQLASFCYVQSRDNTDMTGVIGVLPPASFALKDVSQWIGQLPTTTDDANGNVVVSTNGTGLLGNKWMSGRIASASNGLTAHIVDGVAGLYNGGLISTDTGWLDDTQLKDDNDHLIDIGKYISVVATWATLANPARVAAYTATGAPTYGGFYSTLAPESAPTNKSLRNVRLPFRVGTSKLDLMAGQRFVTFHQKTQGVVVSDAPTAARPDSDYQRLSTMRQVKACIDEVRRVGEPFLGEGISGARLAALDTSIDNALRALTKRGVIVRYEHQVSSTPTQRVQGKATVELKIVPAFELRQLTIVVALSAV
jgi:hypothetical protein